MMPKDLDAWGRDKARKRYQDGGGVPTPRPRPDIEGAARRELGRRMRSEPMPNNSRDLRMPYVRPDQSYDDQIDEARSGFQNIKRGGRIKK